MKRVIELIGLLKDNYDDNRNLTLDILTHSLLKEHVKKTVFSFACYLYFHFKDAFDKLGFRFLLLNDREQCFGLGLILGFIFDLGEFFISLEPS